MSIILVTLKNQTINNKEFYHKLTNLDFFSQIKISLGAKASLGTDSGSMWVLSAYAHPTITLLTNWYTNHTNNLYAALPMLIKMVILYLKKMVSKI